MGGTAALPASWSPRPFSPARWAHGPHAQTLLARLLRPAGGPPYRRERLDTPDGDFLDVDFGPVPEPGAPLGVVLHGLEGSSRRKYVRLTCAELLSAGIQPVAMNFRTCGGEPNRTPRMYHSGETGDLAFLLDTLAHRFPDRPLAAVGFSLGGNVLLKYLGERGSDVVPGLRAAAAISVPYDLAAGGRLLESTRMGRLYTRYFLRSLFAKIRAKEEILRDVIDIPTALRSTTLRAFDDRATAPLHGFRDAADYYARSSSAGYLPGVTVPTLLIHALDDPFLPSACLPRDAIAHNPALRASFHACGGHVGFVEGTPWQPAFWAEREAARFLAHALALPGADGPARHAGGSELDERAPGP